jgi:hypothetical protein
MKQELHTLRGSKARKAYTKATFDDMVSRGVITDWRWRRGERSFIIPITMPHLSEDQRAAIFRSARRFSRSCRRWANCNAGPSWLGSRICQGPPAAPRERRDDVGFGTFISACVWQASSRVSASPALSPQDSRCPPLPSCRAWLVIARARGKAAVQPAENPSP